MPATTSHYRTLTRLSRKKVDKEKGVIFGASLIMQGPALGHGMLIDAKTLETALECAQRYDSGVKIKFNPDTFNHGDGSIAGYFKKESLMIENGKLIGDAYIEEEFEKRDYLLNLAEKQPDTFGISIDFDNEPEDIGGVLYARCVELQAATVVDQPAANSTGLFAVGVADSRLANNKPNATQLTTDTMTDDQFKAMLTEALRPTTEALSGINARLTKLETPAASETEMSEAGCLSTDSPDEKMRNITAYRVAKTSPVTRGDIETIVGATLKKEITTLFGKAGGNPAAGSPGSARSDEDPGKEKSVTPKDAFKAKVKAQFKASRSLATALSRASFDDPKGYTAYQKEIERDPSLAITLAEVAD